MVCTEVRFSQRGANPREISPATQLMLIVWFDIKEWRPQSRHWASSASSSSASSSATVQTLGIIFSPPTHTSQLYKDTVDRVWDQWSIKAWCKILHLIWRTLKHIFGALHSWAGSKFRYEISTTPWIALGCIDRLIAYIWLHWLHIFELGIWRNPTMKINTLKKPAPLFAYFARNLGPRSWWEVKQWVYIKKLFLLGRSQSGSFH